MYYIFRMDGQTDRQTDRYRYTYVCTGIWPEVDIQLNFIVKHLWSRSSVSRVKFHR